MNTLAPAPDALDAPPATWTTEDAEYLYHLPNWSDGYFFINDSGHLAVRPTPDATESMDLAEIVQDLLDEGESFPLLIRFQDVLRSRVVQINEAFKTAIAESGFAGRYNGVYPIKVNQLHEVVEEILEAGKPYGLGLECGSKPELVAALPHLDSDSTLLLCNGYKDVEMLRLMLMGQQLGKQVIPILEKYDEFERIVAIAGDLKGGLQPRFGLRVQLSTRGVGKWAESSGDMSKFGISVPELLRVIRSLEERGWTDSLRLLHFHLGSQVGNIQTLKSAVKEITQVYAQLIQRGLAIEFLDVGGGLGVSYTPGYGNDAINYGLQEYANAIVYTVQEVCEENDVPAPTLVSESGRALTAHHSVLVVEAIGAYDKDEVARDYAPVDEDETIIHQLYETWQDVQQAAARYAADQKRLYLKLLEAYHDALEKRTEANTLFSLGYFSLDQKGLAESLYWTVMREIHAHLDFGPDGEPIPPELDALDDLLVDQYLLDFSVFQSVLDHWAIGQRFPIVPIDRLDEQPRRRALLVDLTCDSDGKISRYVDEDDDKRYLEVHDLQPGTPYFLGFFLMGAYQDIMGDAHNLFGRVTEVHVYFDAEEEGNYYVEKTITGTTIKDMLGQVQYSQNHLHRRMDKLIKQKVEAGVIHPKAGVQMLERYDATFKMLTYLNPRSK